MAEYNNQRYYWIKLTDRFLNSDTVDFLLSQKDGANYVVLYQMVCLKTVNNDGLLARHLGEIIIPYDIEKISRDCKHFSVDTVRVGLELYKKLGLIYQQEDGFLRIADFDRLIGYQSESAEKKMVQRSKNALQIGGGQKVDKCPPDIDKEKEKEIDIEKENPTGIKEKTAAEIPRLVSHRYGEYKNVLLTDDEHRKLLERENGAEAIEYYSEYKARKGYKCKSDYLSILKWVFTAMAEDNTRTPPKSWLQKLEELDV